MCIEEPDGKWYYGGLQGDNWLCEGPHESEEVAANPMDGIPAIGSTAGVPLEALATKSDQYPSKKLSISDGSLVVDYGEMGQTIPLSEQASRVCNILVEAMILFAEKNAGYGPTSEHLGAKGQYADMHRKMGKLKHTLWDGNPTVGEDIEEMLLDLIGHSGLTVDFLREEGL